MKLWNLIKRIGGHSPKKSNIHFTESPHGNGMSYDEAMQEVEKGYGVRKTDWPEARILVYLNEKGEMMLSMAGYGSVHYIPTTADQWGGDNWVRCGKVE